MLVSGQGVRKPDRVVIGLTGEVDLIDADDRRQIEASSGDQIAVHQLGPERRFAPGGNHKQLVHVGDDHLLQVAVEHVGASQRAAPWQDGFDKTALVTVVRDHYLIACGQHVTEAAVGRAERAAQGAQQRALGQRHPAQP